jgi:hypothetical protein
VVEAFDRTCKTEWRTGHFEKISAQRRAERQNRAARRPQRLQRREEVEKQIYEGIWVVFWRKIDGNRPFGDLEKLMFGGSHLLLVCTLQRWKAPNVQGLKDMWGMSRHAEGNNVVVLADILKSDRVMGLMAVKDK